MSPAKSTPAKVTAGLADKLDAPPPDTADTSPADSADQDVDQEEAGPPQPFSLVLACADIVGAPNLAATHHHCPDHGTVPVVSGFPNRTEEE